MTQYLTPAAILVTAPETTITGIWVSDSPGALGSAATFVETTGAVTGLASIDNGRAPATWSFEWNASLSFPQCDGDSKEVTVPSQGAMVDIYCFEEAVGENTRVTSFYPTPIYLATPPATGSISYGSGFSSKYGMPIVQYISSTGTLVAQSTATSVSADGTSMNFNVPSLASVPPDDYAALVSNRNANGTYSAVGAATAFVATARSSGPPPVKNH